MTCFDPTYFDPTYFDTCTPTPPTPVVDEHHGGLFLDPPPGWRAIDPEEKRKHRRVERYYGPLREQGPLIPVDDPDELWLLGLTDLETN